MNTVALPAETKWRRFSGTLVSAAALVFLASLAFLLAVDPYDTGRTGLLRGTGVPEQYPTTANASRGRNLAFDAAIVSNSRGQQLRPERLDRLTGLSFVSLSMPGSNPADQLAVARWFLSARPTPPKALVVAMDAPWCLPVLLHSARFPEWLYERSFVAYLVGLIRYRSFEAAAARIAMLRTGKREARRDGYWDYAPHFERVGLSDPAASRPRLDVPGAAFSPNPAGIFPAVEALGHLFVEMGGSTIFVLLRPPVYQTSLPEPGTAEDRVRLDCAEAIRKTTANRSDVVTIDLLAPGSISREPRNFYDHDHYRDSLAVEIEKMIADGIRSAAPRQRSERLGASQ